MHSYYPIIVALYKIYTELRTVDLEQFNDSSSSILMISIAASVSFLIITLPCLICLSAFASKELSDLLILMQDIDSKSRSQASSFISIEKDNNVSDESNDSFPNSGVLNLFILISLMLFLLHRELHSFSSTKLIKAMS
jgi:hypothetical protein